MKRIFLFIFVSLVFALIFSQSFYSRNIFSAEKTAFLMSTPVRVKVEGPGAEKLAEQAIQEMKRLESEFSRFDPSNEVGMINKLAGKAPHKVSSDTFKCVELAVRMSKLSKGAFDITLGRARDLVLFPRTKEIFLKRKGVKIDLGGIGKGYAAEAARGLLVKKGAKSGMIDMRSSIAVFGPKSWKIGIQHPRNQGQLIGIIELKEGQSLSTSGDYERGQHIIDPRKGKPAAGCQSVTVIGKDAAFADALSTAVFILGPEEGIKLIGSLPDTEALIVDARGKIIKSAGFNLMQK
jgi:thiamine biosynthesis lipoprotein